MKKILFILIMFLGINNIYAESVIDITDKVELKAKWYKEVKEETYYKKGVPLEGYIEDETKIRYNDDNTWSASNCKEDLDNQEYQIVRTYAALRKIDNIRITNIDSLENITVLNKNKAINFKTVKNNNEIHLQLDDFYNPENITIIIPNKKEFLIELLYSTMVSTYKYIKDETTIKVDNTWSLTEDSLVKDITIDEIKEGPFRSITKTEIKCALGEIETYRYKITKEYYDDDYHSYVENYLPDINTVKVYYQGKLIDEPSCPDEKEREETLIEEPQVKKEKDSKEKTKVVTKYIETEKIVPEYIEASCPQEVITKYIEKEPQIEYKYITNTKIPNKIYLLISSLGLIILMLIVIILRKMSHKRIS